MFLFIFKVWIKSTIRYSRYSRIFTNKNPRATTEQSYTASLHSISMVEQIVCQILMIKYTNSDSRVVSMLLGPRYYRERHRARHDTLPLSTVQLPPAPIPRTNDHSIHCNRLGAPLFCYCVGIARAFGQRLTASCFQSLAKWSASFQCKCGNKLIFGLCSLKVRALDWKRNILFCVHRFRPAIMIIYRYK